MTAADAAGEPVYLGLYLAPFAELLAREDLTDFYVNRPGEVWAETVGGGVERLAMPALDEKTLSRLARQIAAFTHQGISRAHPLLAATLPDGSRVQVIAPPATRGGMLLAVRKHVVQDMSLADYTRCGAFSATSSGALADRSATDTTLRALRDAGEYGELLATAVRARRNILIAGGTSTGKTTFLNALIAEIPARERLIYIEDTPELKLRHENGIGLLAARSALGEASVTADDLLAASLRMRPDRIILGELRGPEAFTFLRAVNTGHPGSMTTVHADSPQRAIEQIALLVLQTGTSLARADVDHYVRSTIDVYVQLARSDGRRHISEVILRD
ncbi:MAG: P-type DNA transfer ATPase VirB11 [Sphingopyxis sp.]|uniref:P-type DNA transfer ATPase VirB11 n=1 Tax=Sphingopyxis sp. TaxID=1908224 RepID=UPI003D810E11